MDGIGVLLLWVVFVVLVCVGWVVLVGCGWGGGGLYIQYLFPGVYCGCGGEREKKRIRNIIVD